MNAQTVKRNHALDWIKFALACMVVLIHVPLPGLIGSLLNCLGRIAVPAFFAISGYYAFAANLSVIRRRMVQMLKLLLLGAVIYYVWNLFFFVFQGNGSAAEFIAHELSFKNAALFLLFQYNWYLEHLWYLAAMIVCYLSLSLYTQFSSAGSEPPLSYRGFYLIGGILFVGHFICAAVAAANIPIPTYLYRNGWFFGIPMFSLGLFLREYRSQIIDRLALTDRRLAMLFLLGMILSLIQWLGLGIAELPLGAILQTTVLLLYVTGLETRWSDRAAGWASAAGSASMVMYLLHWLFYRFLRDMRIPEALPKLTAGTSLLLILLACAVIGFSYGWIKQAVLRQKRSLRKD